MEQNRATALENARREDAMLSKADEAALDFATKINAQQLTDLTALSTSLQKAAEAGTKAYWQIEAKRGINRGLS